MKSESCSVVSDSLRPLGLYSPWNSPDQNTGERLPITIPFSRGIFPTQGSSPDLPHFKWILYQLSYKGSQRISGWVSNPFSCYKNYLHYYVCLTCSLSFKLHLLCHYVCIPSQNSFKYIYIYLFTWQYRVLIVACGIICGMWDLASQPGTEPRPLVLEAWSVRHWTTREVPLIL